METLNFKIDADFDAVEAYRKLVTTGLAPEVELEFHSPLPTDSDFREKFESFLGTLNWKGIRVVWLMAKGDVPWFVSSKVKEFLKELKGVEEVEIKTTDSTQYDFIHCALEGLRESKTCQVLDILSTNSALHLDNQTDDVLKFIKEVNSGPLFVRLQHSYVSKSFLNAVVEVVNAKQCHLDLSVLVMTAPRLPQPALSCYDWERILSCRYLTLSVTCCSISDAASWDDFFQFLDSCAKMDHIHVGRYVAFENAAGKPGLFRALAKRKAVLRSLLSLTVQFAVDVSQSPSDSLMDVVGFFKSCQHLEEIVIKNLVTCDAPQLRRNIEIKRRELVDG